MIGLDALTLGGVVTEGLRCSRARCTDPAEWALRWRNPKIHTADRRKTWLACDEHRAVLARFLTDRDFPLTIVPLGELHDGTD